MALLTVSFFSDVLRVDTSMTVLYPQACGRSPNMSKGPYKVLYLLHGLKQDETSWVRNSALELYLKDYPLVVVMPSVGRSFYTDQASGYRYFTYVSEEIPNLVQSMFHVSSKREDTYVAGLSMGGYGALKLALSKPGQYSHAASLSGAVDVAALCALEDTDGYFFPDELSNTFGDLNDLVGSKHDLFHLAKNIGGQRPSLYISCGTEDALLESNRKLVEALQTGFEVTGFEESGGHTWEYWDRNIKRVLDWLPLNPISVAP